VKSILQSVDEQQECMLHALGEYVLSFGTQTGDFHVTTEEVKQLGRVGHPYSKSQCISIAFLQKIIIANIK